MQKRYIYIYIFWWWWLLCRRVKLPNISVPLKLTLFWCRNILLLSFQHGQPHPSTSDSIPTSLPPSPPPVCPTPSLLCLAALVWPLPSLAGGRSRCPELANNNQGVALCDTPSLGLDNEQAPDSRFAGEWHPLEHGPMGAEDWAWECWRGRGGEKSEEDEEAVHELSVRRIKEKEMMS